MYFKGKYVIKIKQKTKAGTQSGNVIDYRGVFILAVIASLRVQFIQLIHSCILSCKYVKKQQSNSL